MKRLWTLGVLFAAIGCGNSSPTTQTTIPRAFITLSLPERVVAVPSTDSGFAMEAAIPMVLSEKSGVGAQIEGVGVEVTDEATGVRSTAVVSRATPVEHISARGTVELPLRVYVMSAATYRATVTLYVWDDGAPSSTGSGDLPLYVNQRSGERSQFSGDFRLLPPQ